MQYLQTLFFFFFFFFLVWGEGVRFGGGGGGGRVCVQKCIKEQRHYENTPIQVYRKFHLLKTENFT